MTYPHAIRALRHRNFRRFFVGQTVSQLGSWMQSTALMWLAYRVSGSTAITGTIGFLTMAPFILVTPLAGALGDRVSRRKLLMVVLSLSLVQATILAVLTGLDHISIAAISALALMQGVLNGVEIPTRHAFFVQLIDDKADLPSAIALNSININGTRLIGPAIGGIVIATWGETLCFALNAISYLAVIVQLARIRPHEPTAARAPTSLAADLVEGWRFALSHPVIRVLLLALATVSFSISAYTSLMPAIAVQTFASGAALNGLFISFVGLGAFVGAIAVALRASVRGLAKWFLLTASCAAIGAIGFSFSRDIWLSCACMALLGMGLMGSSVSVNTIIQSIVDEDKRARVVSIYSTAFTGAAPIGHLAAGWLAEHIGAPRTFAVGGAICAMAAVGYGLYLPRLRAIMRPIYIERGIIPAAEKDH